MILMYSSISLFFSRRLPLILDFNLRSCKYLNRKILAFPSPGTLKSELSQSKDHIKLSRMLNFLKGGGKLSEDVEGGNARDWRSDRSSDGVIKSSNSRGVHKNVYHCQ